MTPEQLREAARYWFHPRQQPREVTPGTAGQIFDILADLADELEAIRSNYHARMEAIELKNMELSGRVEKLDKLMDAWDRCDNKPGDDSPAPCPADCRHKKALEQLLRIVGRDRGGWYQNAVTQACDMAGLPYPWSKGDE